MSVSEALQAISAIEKKLSLAIEKRGALKLIPEEVAMCVDLGFYTLISRAKEAAIQEYRKCHEQSRKASIDAEPIGSTTTACGTVARAAPTIISSGMIPDADGQSALQRARRFSKPRKDRSMPIS